jgi:HYR domain
VNRDDERRVDSSKASRNSAAYFLKGMAVAALVALVGPLGGCNRAKPEAVGATKQAIEATSHLLSGTVFGGGSAMPGTLVEAMTDGTTTVVASSTTDVSGGYSLSLDDATYDLRVTPPAGSGYDVQTVQNVVMAGADKRDDIVLIAKGGVVAGQVRGYGGIGLAGIYVAIEDSSNYALVASTTTNAEGRYSLNLGAGKFTFQLWPPGTLDGAPNGYWYEYVYNQTTAGTTTLDFDLPVVKVQGAVTDSSGAPVSNVVVSSSAYNYAEPIYSYFSSSVQTDTSGHYELLVFKGTNDALAVAPPSPLAVQVLYGLSVVGDMTRDFVVSETTVSGQVRGYGGIGMAGVSVQIMDRYDTSALVVVSTTADSQGRYQLNLAPGSYVVRLQPPDSGPGPAGAPNGGWYDYLNNQTTTGTLDFDLPVAKVQGVVTNSNGAPVPNASVSSMAYEWGDPRYSHFTADVQTDTSGHYELLVFTGTNDSFTVTPPAPLPRVIQTGVAVGGDINRDFVLPDSGVSGQVRGYGGIGLAGVSVDVEDDYSGAILLSTTTDSQGRYQLGLGTGTYRFDLSPPYPRPDGAPNYYWYEELYHQTTASTLDFDLPVAKVQGVVTDSNGAPIPNVSVAAGDYNYTQNGYTDFSSAVQTGPNGHYEILVFTGTATFTVTPPPASGFSITALSNVAVSGDFTQAVILESPDLSPPIIVAGPSVVHLSDTSVSINWQTNEPATSLVDYGVGGLTASTSSAGLVTTHEVTLIGLAVSTVYEYRVSSTDGSGNGPTTSAVLTFRTEDPPGDITPPVITAGPTVTSIGQTTAIITWTTDEPASTVVHYGTTSGLGTDATVAGQFTVQHQITLSGLTAATTYFFVVASTDPDGNGPTSSTQASFTTAAIPDTQAPLILTGPTVTDATDTTLKVVWTTDEAATSGVSYNDGTTYFVVSDATLVTSHEVVLAGLTPATTYHITVSSTDLAGNGPTLGGPVDGKTLASQIDQPPVVTVPADQVAEATGPTGAVVTFAASATDPEDGPLTPVCTPASGATFPLGDTTVTCTATDSKGQTKSATFKVTVRDTTAPVLTLPAPITVDADATGTAVVTFVATATDAVTNSITPTCTPASGTAFPIGTTTVTCTAKDAANNSSSGSFKVTVRKPNAAPVVSVPGGIVAEATGPGGTIVVFVASANDAEDGPLTPTCAPASGAIFPIGATTVTCTAADHLGARGSASFPVAVVDSTPPTLVLPAPIVVDEDGTGGATVSFTVTATDIVSGSVKPVCTPASGSRFVVGATTVSCDAADAAGNHASGTFQVTVRAVNKPPTVTVPANMVVEATGQAGAVVTFVASGNDREDGAITPVCTPASGSTFALGAKTVACKVTDHTGASASASFTVTVVDTSPPVFTFVPPSMTTSTCSAANIGQATATDKVGPVTITNNAPAVFSDGPTVVTWTAKDGAGNTTTATQTVTGACLTCVFGGQELDIKDRTHINGALVGAGKLYVGADGRIAGDAKASGNADLRDRATVTGTLRVAGTVSRASGVVIGTLINPASVLAPTLSSKTFTVGTGTVSIPADATRSLAPGNFGNMTISSRAKVTLTAGTYNFASLDIEPSVTLTLNTAGGPIIINVQGALVFKSQIAYVATSPASITWYSNTSIDLEPQQLPAFPGTLVSPNGLLRIASQNTVNGCVEGGKIVDIEPDNTINGHGL